MFDAVNKHQKIAKIILLSVMLSFVLWGAGEYMNMESNAVVTVGDYKIYEKEIDQEIQASGGHEDRMQIISRLVSKHLLINSIKHSDMMLDSKVLRQAIMELPEFHISGKFNLEKYQQFLKARAFTTKRFEDRVKYHVLLKQVVGFLENSYIDSYATNAAITELLSRQRSIDSYIIPIKPYLSNVSVGQDEIKQYYDQHIDKFTLPTTVQLKYIQLGVADIASNTMIPESTVNAYAKLHKINQQVARIELQKHNIDQIFRDKVHELSDVTYNFPNELDTAAKVMQLPIQISSWITIKSNQPSVDDVFYSEEVQRAITDPDVYSKGHNSRVVSLPDGNFAVYRIANIRPSSVLGLDSVSASITQQIKLDKASELLDKVGQQKIAQLNAKSIKLAFSNNQVIDLFTPPINGSLQNTQKIFSIPDTQLPAYVGTHNNMNDFVIYKVSSNGYSNNLQNKLQQISQALINSGSKLIIKSYIEDLQNKHPVQYNQSVSFNEN